MQANERYLRNFEKLSSLIKNQNDELEFALESLRVFLERDIDGHTSIPIEALAYAVQSRLEEIWSLLSDTDRRRNGTLKALLKKFIRSLEKASGYEADIDLQTPDSNNSTENEIEVEGACGN